jgi:hypothetical protein
VIISIMGSLLLIMLHDYYKSQLEVILLNEKIEELDLELGLMRTAAKTPYGIK